MKRFFVWVALLFLVGCTTPNEEATNSDGGIEHMDNHALGDDHMGEHIHADVPDEYADLVKPVAGEEAAVAAAVAEGKATYEIYCASCHGESGQGDGVAAEALDPKPANLADGTMMMDLGDEYLFWRISEGGVMEPFNSAMPAWKNSLTEEQRWQVVTFVRSLSTGSGEHMDEHSDSP
jgi:mono/diheme cytochrome c family protein